MNTINICISLRSSRIGPARQEIFEKDYETVYKPILKFLVANPDFRIALAFNGVQIEYLNKKHPEIFEILKQLISKKQVEILGGGYYDPAFPLLFPIDRAGQIELLTCEIRKVTGKRPRGITICGSIWDYSLVTNFNSSGMEYVLLDESLIPQEKLKYLPLIMSDKGKSISILPIHSTQNPLSDRDAKDYLKEVEKKVQKTNKTCIERFAQDNKVLNLQFTLSEIRQLLESNWLESLNTAVKNSEGAFEIKTPAQFLKNCESRIPAFISSGMSSEVAQWGTKPYESVKLDKRYPVTIYDFFQIYPQSRALYDRMLYVSLLVNQSHGDRQRKNDARQKLWEAQNGDGFICTSKGSFVSSTYRQQAYKSLTEAERILRQCGQFKESVSSFDYNSDGINEYISRMQNYFAVISLQGGAIRELDVLQNSGNFADNLSRVQEFEGYNDDYERGLFIDHIFNDAEFNSYLDNKPAGNGIFSKALYQEIKFNDNHREIQLFSRAMYQNKQQISLRKNYVLNSSGMMIQYILKNESNSILKAKFAVESSFAQTNFNAKDFNAYKLEILSDDEKKEINTNTSSKELTSSGQLCNVEGFWVTDTDNNISFMFEPNEACNLSFVPIIFNRPEYMTGELVPACMTFANTLCWDIELAPGMEMEKTINFNIFNMHKKRVKKS